MALGRQVEEDFGGRELVFLVGVLEGRLEFGLFGEQLTDFVNNPALYRIELPANNVRHAFEMPR